MSDRIETILAETHAAHASWFGLASHGTAGQWNTPLIASGVFK